MVVVKPAVPQGAVFGLREQVSRSPKNRPREYSAWRSGLGRLSHGGDLLALEIELPTFPMFHFVMLLAHKLSLYIPDAISLRNRI